MSFKVIGKCSECGGRVVVPTVWFGIYPPNPYCETCHAIAKDNLHIIDMNPPKDRWIPATKPPIYVLPPNSRRPDVLWQSTS